MDILIKAKLLRAKRKSQERTSYLYEITSNLNQQEVEKTLMEIGKRSLEFKNQCIERVCKGHPSDEYGAFDDYIEYEVFGFFELVMISIVRTGWPMENKLNPIVWNSFHEFRYVGDEDIRIIAEACSSIAHLVYLEESLVELLMKNKSEQEEQLIEQSDETPSSPESDSNMIFRTEKDERIMRHILTEYSDNMNQNSISHFYYIFLDHGHFVKHIERSRFLDWLDINFPAHRPSRIQGVNQVGKSSDRYTVYSLAKMLA